MGEVESKVLQIVDRLSAPENINRPPIAIRRYGAARRSRNQSSAELNSAVSQICNLLCFGPHDHLAECNSAIQQIENLRYKKSSRLATILGDADRLKICITQNG